MRKCHFGTPGASYATPRRHQPNRGEEGLKPPQSSRRDLCPSLQSSSEDFTSLCPFRKGGVVVSLRHTFQMADLGFSLQAGGCFTHPIRSQKQLLLTARLLFCITCWLISAFPVNRRTIWGAVGGGEGEDSNRNEQLSKKSTSQPSCPGANSS